MTAQSTEPTGTGDLVSEVGSEVKVAIDRWSAGHIGLSDIAVAGFIVALAAGAAWLIRRFARRWTRHLDGTAAAAGLVIGQLVSAAIYLLGVGLVLEVLGFGLGPVVIIVLVVVVIVMLLRPLMENMSSGLLLQLRGPFRPGDLVETNGLTGTIEQVNTRTVVLTTGDGKTVHIPSREVLENALVNHSALGRRRSEVDLRLDPGCDLAEAVDVLRTSAEQLEDVLADPPPEAVVTGFEGSHPCLRVLFWHGPDLPDARRAVSDVCQAAVEALVDSGLALADVAITVGSSGSTAAHTET